MRKPRQTVTPPPPAAPARWREALSDERMAHLIKDAFRRTSRCLQIRLAKHRVSYSHWTLLRILWQGDGITQRQLSDRAGVTEPSTFAALLTMEKLGYISRQKMPNNNKHIRVFLTSTGAALRRVTVAAAEEVNSIALAGISKQDVAATRRTLVAIIQNLETDTSSTLPVADRDGDTLSSAP